MQHLLRLIILVAAVSLLLGGCSVKNRMYVETASQVTVNDSKGDPLVDMRGTPFRFENYRGQWIVVQYWASYCPSCLAMIPEFNALYRGREGKQAMVLGVNYDFVSSAEVNDLVKEFNITYPVTQGDPGPKLGISAVEFLPTTILINPQGKVTNYLTGVQTQVSIENIMRNAEIKQQEQAK